MGYEFNAAVVKQQIIEWIRLWFAKHGPECNAVVGISGGKDSSVVAALCAEALGPDRVIGVLMPNGYQSDIEDSHAVINALGIRQRTINIAAAVGTIENQVRDELGTVSEQAKINLPARIRMSALYAVSQSANGRVANTCNLSENYIGWETLWGDSAGDFAPLAELTVGEVIEIGLLCHDLPINLVMKTPSDGLCGKTDEESFGFSYKELDSYLRSEVYGSPEPHAGLAADVVKKIEAMHDKSRFKAFACNIPSFPYTDLRIMLDSSV